ncbi:delta-like protein D [Lytechinus variegatus]|uniref:delta-like protein D n=1 Tax=Lytechinus variegatus TaxID=7654 RepID=UPI001BB1DEC7|nr:delta-like protein D [Lytechinus variegatus]
MSCLSFRTLTNTDECSQQPCENGGECVNEFGGFICECAEGFVGEVCEIDIDECLMEPCSNGGVCVNLQGSYECICDRGFTGQNCEIVLVVGTGPSCYTELDGSDYRGEVNTTDRGYPCQAWANTHPNRVGDLEHYLFRDHSNYCRNYPGSGKSGPWCYTNIEGIEWEYCSDVPTVSDICNDKPSVEGIVATPWPWFIGV